MAVPSFSLVSEVLLHITLPGALGGIGWFLYALRKGWIRNNKYARKACLEMMGGLLVASVLTLSLLPVDDATGGRQFLRVLLSFGIGVSWSGVIQLLRRKITRIIEAVLGEALDEKEKQ